MAKINSIQLNLQTGTNDGGGTDGSVYLGLGGREFYVDTSADNFESGAAETFKFGAGANVNNASTNDPRKQNLFVETVDEFPVYIRFEPGDGDDRWNLRRAVITFNDQLFPMYDTATVVTTSQGVTLGKRSGKYVAVPKHPD